MGGMLSVELALVARWKRALFLLMGQCWVCKQYDTGGSEEYLNSAN